MLSGLIGSPLGNEAGPGSFPGPGLFECEGMVVEAYGSVNATSAPGWPRLALPVCIRMYCFPSFM